MGITRRVSAVVIARNVPAMPLISPFIAFITDKAEVNAASAIPTRILPVLKVSVSKLEKRRIGTYSIVSATAMAMNDLATPSMLPAERPFSVILTSFMALSMAVTPPRTPVRTAIATPPWTSFPRSILPKSATASAIISNATDILIMLVAYLARSCCSLSMGFF